MLPQPVLIIGTYNEEGTPNAKNAAWGGQADVLNILVGEKYLTEEGQPDVYKMGLITYEPVSHSYVALGETVGKAFSAGNALNL